MRKFGITLALILLIIGSLPVWANASEENDGKSRTLAVLVSANPGDKKLRLELAKAFLGQGNLEKAGEEADILQALYPQDIAAVRVSAEVALGFKRFQEARILSRRLIALEPENADNYLYLQALADKEDQGIGEAEWLLRLARQTTNAELLSEIGNHFFEQGNKFGKSAQGQRARVRFWQLASDALTGALALRPDLLEANEGLTRLYLAEGRGADAYDTASQALKSAPNDPTLLGLAKKAEAAKNDLFLPLKTWLAQLRMP